MLVLLTLIWGLTFPATKAALNATTPLQFLALRFMIGAALFIPLMAIRSRRSGRRLAGSMKKFGMAGAGVGLLLMWAHILQATGLKYTSASRSAFFTGLLTLMVPLFAILFKTSRTSLAVWLALPVALSGIYLLADPTLGGLNYGDVLTIGCAVVSALQMIALEAADNRIKQRNDGKSDETSTDALSLSQMLVVGIGCALLALLEGKPLTIAPAGWWGLGYTAVFGSLIAVWLQTRYQPKVTAGHAGMVFTLEPLWAGFFAWMLLGDEWTTRGLIGAGCIIAAMAISSLGMRNGK